MRVCRKAAQQVGKVLLVLGKTHAVKAPAVVGMEQNQVYLDAHFAQPDNVPIQRVPERVDRAGRIPAAVGVLFKGVIGRFVFVEVVILGEYAHADFVERRFLKGLHGLFNQFVALVDEGVNRGAEGMEQLAVFKAEGFSIGLYHAGQVGILADFRTLSANNAADLPAVFSRRFGQEAHLIHAVSGIESGDGFCFAAPGKFCTDFPAIRQILKCKLKQFVFSHSLVSSSVILQPPFVLPVDVDHIAVKPQR